MANGLSLCILIVQQFLIVKATEICYYHNQSALITISCNDDCCSGMATTAELACCNNVSWSTLAIPVFVVSGICFLAVCFIYFRSLLKICLCGYKCPCARRSRVRSPGDVSVNDNPVYVMNNDDLPDYETTTKASRMKDVTPPPYNFVAAHPDDFGLEARVPSAPPHYCSRSSSIAALGRPAPPVEP